MTIIFDPFSAACHDDPYPVYRVLREEQPLYFSEQYGWWALSRYADIQAVARAPQDFSSRGGVDVDLAGVEFGPGNFLEQDAPDHGRMRGVLRTAFNPKSVAEMGPMIEAEVHELLDGLLAAGEVDLMRDFAWRVPVGVSSRLLGFPASDGPMLRDTLIRWMTSKPGTSELSADTLEATRELREYFDAAIGASLASRATGVIADIADAESAGTISREETRGICVLLFVASIETTASLLGSGLQLLHAHHEQQALLRAEPERLPDAIEEIVRYEAPAQHFMRHTTRPLELLGEQLPAGASVLLVYASGNRDATRWEDPDAFDIGRPSKRHLGFGEGVHHCLGAPVARLEGRIAFGAFLDRVGSYELTSPAERVPSHNARVLRTLPATVRAS
jgi:cytochrome P450